VSTDRGELGHSWTLWRLKIIHKRYLRRLKYVYAIS